MDFKTKAFIKGGYISCIISILIAIFLMMKGLHFAGSDMVRTALGTLVLSLFVGLGIELNNKLK